MNTIGPAIGEGIVPNGIIAGDPQYHGIIIVISECIVPNVIIAEEIRL